MRSSGSTPWARPVTTSPASSRLCGFHSTITRLARPSVVSSSSLPVGRLAPTAITLAPRFTRLPSNSGTLERVAVTMTSAPSQ